MRDQLQAFFLREREHLGRIDAASALPEIDLAAIARDRRLARMARGRAAGCRNRPQEIEPVGQAAGVELHQGARADLQAVGVAPLRSARRRFPGKRPLAGLHVAPADGHDRRVEGREEMLGRRGDRAAGFQAPPSRDASLPAPRRRHGDRLLGIGVGQPLRRVQRRRGSRSGTRPPPPAAGLVARPPDEMLGQPRAVFASRPAASPNRSIAIRTTGCEVG